MNITYRSIADLIFLYKANKNQDKVNTIMVSKWFDLLRKYTKNGKHRNLGASIMKKIRNESPFKPEGNYSENKALYEAYFKMENHIPSYEHIANQVKNNEEVYIVNFRSDAPVKGKRFAEYHLNGSGNDKNLIFKTRDISESGNYINLDSASEGFTGSTSPEFFTNHRYATTEEIEKFKECGIRSEAVKEKIKAQQEIMSALYSEQSKIARYEW